jgi:hypothetical protein
LWAKPSGNPKILWHINPYKWEGGIQIVNLSLLPTAP